MHKNRQKIVCLVPSWTETLVECGLNVVGRTRFCVHPADKVKSIQVVGGTKNFNLSELLELKPDIVIMDKEENKKEMADELSKKGIQLEVSQVTSLHDAADFLNHLSLIFENEKLMDLSQQYRQVLTKKLSFTKFIQFAVSEKNAEVKRQDFAYVIWKNPFMTIGKGTFISNVLSLFGFSVESLSLEKYPIATESELKNTFCLFSSEPYPFAREFQQFTERGFKGALVDGEKISWYGLRNLSFLQACVE